MKNLLLIFAILLLPACTTLTTVKNAKGSGTSQQYSASYDTVWNASLCAIEKENLKLMQADEQSGEILAQNMMTLFSYGENVGIFVKSLKPQLTQVEVISKKTMQTNVFAKDWTDTILGSIDSCLE